MPGLLGIVGRSGGQPAERPFESMLASMNRGGRLLVEKRLATHGSWAIGRVHLGVFQPEAQLSGEGPLRVLFHGELDNAAELRASVASEGRSAPCTAAALVAALYPAHRQHLGRLLRGAFCCAILDEAESALTLVTDQLGSYPLYWFKTRSEERRVG